MVSLEYEIVRYEHQLSDVESTAWSMEYVLQSTLTHRNAALLPVMFPEMLCDQVHL